MIIFPLHGVHSGLLEQVVHARGGGCAEVEQLAKVGTRKSFPLFKSGNTELWEGKGGIKE